MFWVAVITLRMWAKFAHESLAVYFISINAVLLDLLPVNRLFLMRMNFKTEIIEQKPFAGYCYWAVPFWVGRGVNCLLSLSMQN